MASAVDARQKAEQALYTTVLEDYEKWKKKKEADASWGEKNPFHFDVIQGENQLFVITNMTEGDDKN